MCHIRQSKAVPARVKRGGGFQKGRGDMKIVAATNNSKKLKEMERILKGLGFEVLSMGEAGVEVDPEENGETFAANAAIKAAAVAERCGLAAVADDSGLCVDALGGAPGVHTARYCDRPGKKATDSQRMDHILEELVCTPRERRTARFVSAICCVMPDGSRITAEGVCEGWIGYQKLGDKGFGYDPIFMVGGQAGDLSSGRSFAQLTDEEKDAVSHRGKALRAFAGEMESWLQRQGAAL